MSVITVSGYYVYVIFVEKCCKYRDVYVV